jgi:hypothetical protein
VAAVKIRLTDNDIRLRLTEYEVANVLEGREISTTVFKGLVVALVPTDLTASSLETEGSTHIVKIPVSEASTPSMLEPLIYESPTDQSPYILIEMDRPR